MIRLLCLVLLLWPLAALAQGFGGPPRVEARLLADVAVAAPGVPFRVGLDQAIAPGWHTYWKNPGDSGAPTEIDLKLPAGVTAGPILWPAPEAIPYAGLMNHGYEGGVLLARTLTLPKDWPTGIPLRVRAEARWLVCADICVPEQGDFDLLIDTGESPVPSAEAPRFRTAEAALPRPNPFPARFDGDGKTLRLGLDGRFPEGVEAHFFPDEPGVVGAAAPQTLARTADGLALDLVPEEGAKPPERLQGVLVLTEPLPDGPGRQALAVDAPRGAVAAAPVAPGTLGLVGALGLALLGGLVLNLMPCVFPVLSLKALHLAAHRGRAARLGGLAYTGGVLLAFLLLAALLLALKAGGAAVGWGFQLQEPLVVLALAWLTAGIGLWLLTGISLGTRLMGVGAGLGRSGGAGGSFVTGMLAVVVATPCTAPFMAGAVGFALTQGPATAFAVFLALGLGLAAPFLALSFVPALQALLPRPGTWMERLRQALAFPMLATAAWLLWVLSLSGGEGALLMALLGFVVLGFAFWLAGLSGRAARGLALVALVVSLVLPAAPLWSAPEGERADGAAAKGVVIAPPAEPFSAARLAGLRGEGRPVLVNMTAAWCLTCLVNERVALSGGGFEAALKRSGAAYLKGDWTRQDPAITRLLAGFERSGVPLYAVYPAKGPPELLPQLLTPAIVEAALARAAG
ncbi:MAG: thioredoxin family protein [Geminicoccaceae bacterium]|nr:thioredoxin family protein [Geminicoccaceae bacterium]